MNIYTVPELVSRFDTKFPNNPAVSYVGEVDSLQHYDEYAGNIRKVAGALQGMGVAKGDKVAILSANMPNWGVAFFGTALVGAVNVPILPDFHEYEIRNILEHSEAKVVFVSKGLYRKIKDLSIASIQNIVLIDSFSSVSDKEQDLNNLPCGDIFGNEFSSENIEEDDLLSIVYTSGTTGKSKGVMLSHKNILWNGFQGSKIQQIDENDRFLSILPLSHTYENTVGFILPMIFGASVHYLRKAPTASVLLPALKVVRPTLMLSVPLIMEKIYKAQVKAKFDRTATMRTLYKFTPVRKLIHHIAGKKLMETFGGELKFFGIGGAKIDANVERFLREGKFPYAIGYGLSETAPLLAGANPSQTVFQGIGPNVEGLELQIHDADPKTGQGEVWAKGPNVMKGYFKEPKLTKDVLTEDGWFKTGDLGVFDKRGNLHLKGRLKNMLLGASGENIYPEEIESIINNFKYVMESVVVQKGGKLVAMVHFNTEELEKKYEELKETTGDYVDHKIDDLMTELKQYVNTRVNKFSQIQLVLAQPDPFEKTPTLKIKRFLYM